MENNDLLHTMSASEERNWALFSHLGIIAGKLVPFGNIITPLLIWKINKDKSEFIVDHAIEALNFQLTISILFVICGLLCIVLIGIPLIIGLAIINIVVSVMGAIKASRGEYYDYPFNFRFIK